MKKIALATVLISCLLSCKKETPASDGQIEGTTLQLSASILEDAPMEGAGAETFAKAVMQGTVKSQLISKTIRVRDGIEEETTIRSTIPDSSASANGGSATKMATRQTKMATPLATGISYHIHLTNVATNETKDADFKVGSATTAIPVSAGATYKLLAYSYNEPDQHYKSPTVYTPDGNDFLTFETTITANQGSNPVPITFTHRNAAVIIYADATQATSFYDWGSYLYGGPKRGVFDNQTGAYTIDNSNDQRQATALGYYTSTTSPSPVVAGQRLYGLKKDAVTTKDSVLYNYYYFAPQTAPLKVETTIHHLLDYESTTPTLELTDTRSIASQTFVAGQRIVMTRVYRATGTKVGNIFWANGNLFYNYTDKAFRIHPWAKYQQYADNTYPWVRGSNLSDSLNVLYSDAAQIKFKNRPVDFFNANIQYPYVAFNYLQNPAALQSANAGYYPAADMKTQKAGDPCALVKPYGRWRLPTLSEANALIANVTTSAAPNTTANKWTPVSKVVLDLDGAITNRSTTASNNTQAAAYPFVTRDMPEPSFLSAYTMQTSTSGTRGQNAMYWTSTKAPDDPNHPGEDRYYAFYANFEAASGSTSLTNVTNRASGNFQLPNYSGTIAVPYHWGLSVRCVRDNN